VITVSAMAMMMPLSDIRSIPCRPPRPRQPDPVDD
jgi:hypothetical protein